MISCLKKHTIEFPSNFLELGAQNTSHNINTKIMLTLETKLFETTKKVDNILTTAPHAIALFFERPSIVYNQIKLDQNVQQYFNATLRAMSALRLGVFVTIQTNV